MEHKFILTQKALVNSVWICSRCGLRVTMPEGTFFDLNKVQLIHTPSHWTTERKVKIIYSNYELCLSDDDWLIKDIIE